MLIAALLFAADLTTIGAIAPHAADAALGEPVSSLFYIPHMESAGPAPGEWRNFVEFNGANYRPAKVEGRPGYLGLDRYGLSWDLEQYQEGGNVLAFGVDYQRLSYSDTYTLGGTKAPVESADSWRFEAAYHTHSSDRWAWKLGGRAESGVVKGVNPWNELSFGVSAGVTVHATDDLDLEFSLDAYDRLETSDLRLIPLALVDWRLADDLRLGRVAGGYGFDYRFDPHTNYFLSFDYEERSYRLASDGAPAGGLLRDQERSLRAGMVWKPKQAIQLELFAGAAKRHMVLFDNGQDLDNFDVEMAPFLGFRLLFGEGSIF